MDERTCPHCGVLTGRPDTRYCDNCRCSVEGCVRPIKARSLCSAHYQRQRTSAGVRADIPIGVREVAFCSIEGCDLHVLARDWCRKHYQRWMRHGDPLYSGPRKARDEWARLTREENETGKRTCRVCQQIKLLEEFAPLKRGRNGRSPRCRVCQSEAAKDSYEARKTLDPEGFRRRSRAAYLQRTYGTDADAYDALFGAQKGRCAICGKRPRKLVVDHDHETGIVRELLCDPCNLALGFVEDSIERLQVMTSYLFKHKGRLL